ncbi:PulJ/GspJ family protein [Desulfovibrio inopinatus]|uniref:PulJ/GspJ family protein n=1 Tax=Desulfovibrio inopinatus TaxID=102109 RepID=UPI000417AA2E|nr:prepilin-type N-terminal cleavage/methylation domain-containing protein [Desulfovibrio inopinatus]
MNRENPSNTACAHAGFTLIEVLLAVAICAIAVTGIFTMVQAVLHMAERVQLTTLSTEIDQAFFDRLENDLHSLYISSSNTNEVFAFFGYDLKEESNIEKAREDEESTDRAILEFACLSSFSLGLHREGHRISRVRYVLRERDDETSTFDFEKTYRLIRLESPYADLEWRSKEKRPWIEMELLPMVRDVRMSFKEIVSGEEVEETTWSSLERVKKNKPAMPQILHIEVDRVEKNQLDTLTRVIGFPRSEYTFRERN